MYFARRSGMGNQGQSSSVEDVSLEDLQYRFKYGKDDMVSRHSFAKITGQDSLDTTMLYVSGTHSSDLQRAVEEQAPAPIRFSEGPPVPRPLSVVFRVT